MQVTHSIHDQTVYLTQEHKRKLKEKYGKCSVTQNMQSNMNVLPESQASANFVGVDPWTFEQHVGEAVFIPAGCAYQVRNLKVPSLYFLDNDYYYFC